MTMLPRARMMRAIDPASLIAHTQRLIVRPLHWSDWDVWRDAWSRPTRAPNPWALRPLQPVDLEEAAFDAIVQRHQTSIAADHDYHLMIFSSDERALLGHTSLMDVSRGIFQNAYLGYAIFDRHWRRGYALEACHATLSLAMHTLGLHRVEAGIEPDNLPSRALAERLGMRLEGVSAKRLYLRDAWRDICVYAMTRELFEPQAR